MIGAENTPDDPLRPWYKRWLINKKMHEKQLAVEWFAKIISNLFIADLELMFVAIPPSNSKTVDDGPTMLVAEIKKLSKNFRNGSKRLIRHKDKTAAHTGGDRSEEGNRATLKISKPEQLRDKTVILIDGHGSKSGYFALQMA